MVIGNCGVTFAPCKPEDRGYEQVIVNGQVFMEHGEHTGGIGGPNVAQLTNLASETVGATRRVPRP